MGKLSLGDRIRLGLAVGIAKTITATVKALRLGAASVLPGRSPVVFSPSVSPSQSSGETG